MICVGRTGGRNWCSFAVNEARRSSCLTCADAPSIHIRANVWSLSRGDPDGGRGIQGSSACLSFLLSIWHSVYASTSLSFTLSPLGINLVVSMWSSPLIQYLHCVPRARTVRERDGRERPGDACTGIFIWIYIHNSVVVGGKGCSGCGSCWLWTELLKIVVLLGDEQFFFSKLLMMWTTRICPSSC